VFIRVHAWFKSGIEPSPPPSTGLSFRLAAAETSSAAAATRFAAAARAAPRLIHGSGARAASA
jgi:hypothetical protein